MQRTIQILKRHRDIRFAGSDMELDKPISMIITTLSAQLYKGESDIYSTIQNIIDELDKMAVLLNPGNIINSSLLRKTSIDRSSDGVWKIPNPVNPSENFADRWHENSDRKAKAFSVD